MKTSGLLLGAALLLGLVACSGEQAGSNAAPLPKLETLTVTAGGGGIGASGSKDTGIRISSTPPAGRRERSRFPSGALFSMEKTLASRLRVST